MPTDLPPDYKPAPKPKTPGTPEPGSDLAGGGAPAPGLPAGTPGPAGDVVDPVGWAQPPDEPADPTDVPQPAGTPSF